MILLQVFNKESAIKWEVLIVYFLPFDEQHGLGKTKEELEAEGGIFVDTLPPEQCIEGMKSNLYINPETKQLWYEYTEIQKEA